MLIEVVLLSGLIIFTAHFVKGASGFGSALIAIPLLTLYLDIKFVVSVFFLFGFASNTQIALHNHDHVDRRSLVVVSSGLVLGTILGVYLLVSLATTLLQRIFGTIVIIFGLWLIMKNQEIKKQIMNSRWGVLMGIFGGVSGGMFSMDGPFLVLYLSRMLRKKAFRATLTAIFLVSALWRGTLYFFGGLLTLDVAWFFLQMVSFLVLGVIIGSHFQNRLSQRTFDIIVGAILIIAGIMLIL